MGLSFKPHPGTAGEGAVSPTRARFGDSTHRPPTAPHGPPRGCVGRCRAGGARRGLPGAGEGPGRPDALAHAQAGDNPRRRTFPARPSAPCPTGVLPHALRPRPRDGGAEASATLGTPVTSRTAPRRPSNHKAGMGARRSGRPHLLAPRRWPSCETPLPPRSSTPLASEASDHKRAVRPSDGAEQRGRANSDCHGHVPTPALLCLPLGPGLGHDPGGQSKATQSAKSRPLRK